MRRKRRGKRIVKPGRKMIRSGMIGGKAAAGFVTGRRSRRRRSRRI